MGAAQIKKVFNLITILIIFCLNSSVMADNSCKSLAVAVDTNWPPYAITDSDGNISGVGIDIVNRIFLKLDIPVQFFKIEDRRRIMHALELGDIDLILSVYDNQEYDYLRLVEPHIAQDNHTIAVKKEDAALNLLSWEDLIGKRGLATNNLRFSKDFVKFKEDYLYVQNAGNLNDIIEMVAKQKADYIVGSENQLRYLVESSPSKNFVVAKNINKKAFVYLAFSKKSNCLEYYPYVVNQLKLMQKEGQIKAAINAYIKSAKPKEEHTNQDNKEYDFEPEFKDLFT